MGSICWIFVDGIFSLLHLTWLNFRCEDVTLACTVSRILNQSIFHHKSNIDAECEPVCMCWSGILFDGEKSNFQIIIFLTIFFMPNLFPPSKWQCECVEQATG